MSSTTAYKDWVGTVQKLSSNNEGKGVLNVSMSKIANAATWNNSLSDIGDKTLIEPGTPLHDAAVQLSRGDTIVFSGTFIKANKDCFKESSITQKGSMTDPDWIFRFSSVAAVAPAEAPAATAPAQGRLTVRECGDKWTAAKKAGTLGDQKWSAFKKAQCGW